MGSRVKYTECIPFKNENHDINSCENNNNCGGWVEDLEFHKNCRGIPQEVRAAYPPIPAPVDGLVA